MKIIYKYCREAVVKYPKMILCSVALMCVMTLLDILIPYGMRSFIDSAALSDGLAVILLGLAGFAVCMLVNSLIEIQWYILLDTFGGSCIDDLTLEIERAMANTSQNHIDSIGPDRIKHMMYADILDVFRVIGHHIPNLLGTVITMTVCFILAACYDWKLAVFIFAASALGFGLSFASRNRIAKKAGQTNGKLKKHHGVCNEYADALMLVQTNNILPYFHEKTKNSIWDFIRTSQKEDWTIMFWTRLVINYNTLFTIALSALIVARTSEGSMINLVFFTMLSGLISTQSQSAQQLIQQIMRALVSFKNVDMLRTLPPRQGSEVLEKVQTIRFEHVDFAYDHSSETVLKNLSCEFHGGEIIRLAGGNGSGKSTFVKLLMGLYPPAAGQLLVNERDARVYSQDSLNRQLLYINQDEILLNETAGHYLEVITGKKIDARALPRVPEMVDLQKEIENGGLNLSVGQRKKLLILKMILRAPEASVIILDEIEAGLEAKTRELYLDEVQKLAAQGDKIIFMIEHETCEGLVFDKVVEFCQGHAEVTEKSL